MASPEALLRWLRQWRRDNLVVDRVDVLRHVDEGGELAPRFAFMTLMSAGIAMLGLLQGSGAVIIGAMLISPLMGPIVEMGMALATFDLRTLRDSLKNMGVGVALALLISILIVTISPLQEPTQEILSRTEPTLFDLLVAIFSGLAGAYATITRKGETIVGVAIATALMPPLAVVGFGIAVGNASIAGGAAFLFMTNLLAIALSVTVVARWYGFGRADSPRQTAWQAMLIISCFVLLSIPLGLALRNIAARGFVDRSIRTTLEASAQEGGGRITTLRVDRNGQTVLVDAVLMTPKFRPRLGEQLERQLEDTLGQPVVVELREVLTADDQQVASEQASLAELHRSVDRLQSSALRESEARTASERASRALQQRALGHFGELEIVQGGNKARWQLRADAGLDLGAARRLEASLLSARDGPRTRVIPAVQALPRVGFADDASTLDAAAIAALEDIAWAMDRWQSTEVQVEGHAGGDSALAEARAQAVATWLRAHSVAVGEVKTASNAATRALALREGQAAGRSVEVQPVAR
ncbi:MAG: DUF389 domain-containing protein [Pseudoxanthomonas sp.]